MPRSYDEAFQRIPTQRDRIISALRDAGEEGLTNAELSRISLQYNSRLSELYKEGYIISCEHLNNGLYKYVLKAVPGGVVVYPTAEEETFFEIETRFEGFISSENLYELLQEKGYQIVRKPGWFKMQMNIVN